MENLQELIKEVIDNGQRRSTRSGVTYSVFDRDLSFDLRERFPLPTAKSVNMDSVMAELCMFLSGRSDRRYMQEFMHGNFMEERFDIWKGDCLRGQSRDPSRFNGYNLGDMYSEMWRMKRVPPSETIKIAVRKDLDADYKAKDPDMDERLDLSVLSRVDSDLYSMWADMISLDGVNGMSVSPRWYYFSNFLKDIYTVSGFQLWRDDKVEYSLDALYFGNGVYSRNTCLFVSKSTLHRIPSTEGSLMGGAYQVGPKLYGTLYELLTSLNIKSASGYGEELSQMNLDITRLEDSSEFVYRPRVFFDQMQALIYEMTSNPYGRYHVVDNWNPEYQTKCVLGACHKGFQVYVDDETNEFDLSFTLRSSDLFLGSYYNIASYAALMEILGKITNLTPRMLKVKFLDCHAYEEHMPAIDSLLLRDTSFQPTKLIMPDIKCLSDLEGLTAKDFKVEGYEPLGPIRAPLLVG